VTLALAPSGTLGGAQAQPAQIDSPAGSRDAGRSALGLGSNLPEPILSSWSVETHGSNLQVGAAAAARVRLPSAVQLGASLGGASLNTYYVDGYERLHGSAFEAQARAVVPLAELAPAAFTFSGTLGGRQVWLTDDVVAVDHGTRVFSELGLMAHIRVGSTNLVRVGPIMLFDFEVKPSFAPASLGQLIHVGHALSLGERVALNARLEAGGTYGFDGNNEKFLVRGGVELMARFGEGSGAWLVF